MTYHWPDGAELEQRKAISVELVPASARKRPAAPAGLKRGLAIASLALVAGLAGAALAGQLVAALVAVGLSGLVLAILVAFGLSALNSEFLP